MKIDFIRESETTESGQTHPVRSTRPSNVLSDSMRSRARDLFTKRLMRWMCPERRLATRYPEPPLIAYLGTVRSSQEYRIGDVSITGFYMITEDRWFPGTVVPVTLERTDQEDMRQSLCVNATVVRSGSNGVGFSFVPDAIEQSAAGEIEGGSRVNLTRLAQFLKGLPLTAPNSEEAKHTS